MSHETNGIKVMLDGKKKESLWYVATERLFLYVGINKEKQIELEENRPIKFIALADLPNLYCVVDITNNELGYISKDKVHQNKYFVNVIVTNFEKEGVMQTLNPSLTDCCYTIISEYTDKTFNVVTSNGKDFTLPISLLGVAQITFV